MIPKEICLRKVDRHRLEPVLALRGFDHWFSSAYTFPSC
jgi:hypothetical protein